MTDGRAEIMEDEVARAVAEFELTPEDWEDVNAEHLFDSILHQQLVGRTRVVSLLLFLTLAVPTRVDGRARAGCAGLGARPPGPSRL